jgi:radical SAM protein with 4Fe4S-binding SPASM domain
MQNRGLAMRSYYWPQNVVWETTLRCNMRCNHCGSIAGDARANELNTAEALDLCDQLAELGAETIILSGGETLLRHDWYDIANRIVEHGLSLGLITNGITLTQGQTLEKLCDLHQRAQARFGLGISIDGVEQAHEEIRGIKGCYAKTLHAIESAHRAGLRVFAMTTVNRRNFDELTALREVLFNIGLHAWQFQTLNAYGRIKERRDWLLTPEQYGGLCDFIIENKALRSSAPRSDAADCIGYFGEKEPLLRGAPWRGCQAGIRGIGIEADGKIKGCLSLLDDIFYEGNIRDESLAQIWDKPGAFSYNRDFTPDMLEGLCRDCAHGKACAAGCRGTAHSNTGSFYSAPYCLYGFSQHDKL